MTELDKHYWAALLISAAAGAAVIIGMSLVLRVGFGVDVGFGGMMVLGFVGGSVANTLHPRLAAHLRAHAALRDKVRDKVL